MIKMRLKDFCAIRYGKDHKKLGKGIIPAYGSGGIMRYVDKAISIKPSVLIPRKGTLTNLFYSNKPFWTVDTLFWTEINEKVCEPKYLYYLLKTKNLSSYDEGTAVPSLTTQTLNEIELNIPSLEQQKRIIDVLSSLDNKVENNNLINRNLEQYSQAYFKKNLAKFDSIPSNWEKAKLSNIAEYLNGLAMQKYRPTEDESGIPVLKIKELRQGFCDENSEFCSKYIMPKYIVNDGDVIFSWSGSLIIDFWCGGICGLNQHLFKVTSYKFKKWFYYAWTKHYLNRFIFTAADKATTMGHIKRGDLDTAEVLIPSEGEYNFFSSIFEPIYEKIISNRIENRKLATLRDSLLTKLMSGELDISSLNL